MDASRAHVAFDASTTWPIVGAGDACGMHEIRGRTENVTTLASSAFASSVIGLFGIVAATFMVTIDLAGWQDSVDHLLVLFPFARTAGGIVQFLAGMWAYNVRDAFATAMHGFWGFFWIAYGLYTLLVGLGVLFPRSSPQTAPPPPTASGSSCPAPSPRSGPPPRPPRTSLSPACSRCSPLAAHSWPLDCSAPTPLSWSSAPAS
ncbi:hypothetical protein HF577_09665 [Pseudonocardia xinjiangensis]|uniref:Uncharacterized protein n=3 Tax=Pseudonocardia xinjiangensis TaxID=75289 RepID=A0ABX1RCH3_9PSEU|nr:hypothetical protein [Pseudonocardia xinjiangensis]